MNRLDGFLRDRVDCYEIVVGEEDAEMPEMVEFYNYKEAIKMINKHMSNESIIKLHADVDMDGIGCGYIMNTFLKNVSSNADIKACINKEKIHGLSDKHVKYFNSSNANLVIIMDSSSNHIELIKQINCDVLVIDHHEVLHNELSGDTAGGKYIIVNNMISNGNKYKAEPRMSGAMVVYELLRQYQKEYLNEDILDSKMLYQWVGVTLLTDVIPTGNKRNQWYMDNTVYKSETEISLSVMLAIIDSRQHKLDKSFINYKLAPVFNRAIRAGASAEALNIALNKPSEVDNLSIYKDIQDKILDRVSYTLTDEKVFEDTEKLNIVEKDNYCLCDITNTSISKSYTGLIATKMLDIRNKNAIAGLLREETNFIDGSFRGKCSNIDYRKSIAEKGYFSEGHHGAFGLKVPKNEVDTIMDDIGILENSVDNRPYLTAGDVLERYQGKYHIDDFNAFKKAGLLIRLAIANSKLSTHESVNIVIPNDDFEEIASGDNWRKVKIFGLECWVFETLKTEFLNLYVEFSGEIKAYLKNRWM